MIFAAIVMRVVVSPYVSICLTTDDTIHPQGIMPAMMLVQVELRKQAIIIREDSVIPSRTPPGVRTISSISFTAHPHNTDPLSTVRKDTETPLESGLLAGHGTEMHAV